jgi:hypothetical protein
VTDDRVVFIVEKPQMMKPAQPWPRSWRVANGPHTYERNAEDGTGVHQRLVEVRAGVYYAGPWRQLDGEIAGSGVARKEAEEKP